MHSLFKYAIYENKWLWFHVMAGGFLSRLIIHFFHSGQLAVDIVLGLAVVWEILEYFKDDVEKNYGNKKHFFLDALGDIAGAVAMAIIVVL